jgi:ParB-like chromosome segregation protein Spo0J
MGGQAFDGPRINGFWIDPFEARIIGIDTLDGPEHPLWDISERNREGDPMLAAEIIVDGGIHEPCILRKDGEKYDVVVGRRRFLAARLIKREPNVVRRVLDGLGITTAVQPVLVPVIIEKGDDAKFATLVAVENAQRRDLDLLQKSQQAMRLLDRVKDKRRVAAAYGVTVQTIIEWGKVQDLDTKVVAMIGAGPGRISLSAATKLASLPRAEQVDKLTALVANGNGKVTIAKTKAAARGQESAALSRSEIRKIAESEDVAAEIRNFARCVLGEYPASKIKGVSKALEG